MAAGGAQYTVFGFDSRIDWKPTVFVDGIPHNRVCSACGLVSAATALLPCNHLLCSRCYDAGGDGERNRCPLDKDVCQSEDVIWSTFTKEKLLGRKIQCWNSSSGCDVMGALFQVVDHFEKDCQYHAVTCFRCKKSMAYKELLGHLETNDCSIAEATSTSISHANPAATITTFVDAVGQLRDQLSSLQTCFRETKELYASHVQVFRERVAADMLVAESVQTVDNTLKESTGQSQVAAGRTAEELALVRSSASAIENTLREVVVLINEMNASSNTSFTEQTREILATCRNLQKKLDGLSAPSTKEFEKIERKLEALQKSLDMRVSGQLDVKDSLERLNERLSDDARLNGSVSGKVAKVFLELSLCSSEPLIWTVEKWSELKEEAATEGEARALFEKPKYFYGYSIHPGVQLEETNDELTLHLVFCICQGSYDALLTWPFPKKLHLNVLNAEGEEIPESITSGKRRSRCRGRERPTTERNNRVISYQFIKVTEIERLRCVKNDKVSVKFTVSYL